MSIELIHFNQIQTYIIPTKIAMKTNNRFANTLVMILVFVACNDPKKEKPDYEIASPVYITLTEKSLDYWASLKLNSFAEMLADSVEYELPDGKKLKGKIAVVDFWKAYIVTSGLQSMVIVNANYLPVNANTKPKGSGKAGIKVVADFTNKMTFKEKTVALEMTFNFHFNKEKLVDNITTFYDSSKMQKP